MKADDHTFDMHPAKDQRTIAATLAALPHDRALPTLLLHHSPVGLHYAEAAGVNLMLAGYTMAASCSRYAGRTLDLPVQPWSLQTRQYAGICIARWVLSCNASGSGRPTNSTCSGSIQQPRRDNIS
jgi:hypothetical protein